MFLFNWINYKCPIKSRMSNSQRPKIQPGGAATPPIRIPISNYGNLMNPHILVQTGMTQHMMVQPGMTQHMMVQPGMTQHILIQPVMAQHMMGQHILVQPGTSQPVMAQYIIGSGHDFVVGNRF